MQPTAQLENWKLIMLGGNQVYLGEIYGDTKGRFPDGRRVHTSAVISHHMAWDAMVVRTVNSYYQLGNKFEEQLSSELAVRYADFLDRLNKEDNNVR